MYADAAERCEAERVDEPVMYERERDCDKCRELRRHCTRPHKLRTLHANGGQSSDTAAWRKRRAQRSARGRAPRERRQAQPTL